MAKINKLKKIIDGILTTIYPVTIPQAVVDPTSGKSARAEFDEKANHGYESGQKTLKAVDDAKADHGYESNPKSLKEVDDEKADHGYAVEETPKTLKEVDTLSTQNAEDISQLAGEVSDSTEKTGAASLAELNARLLALEKIVSATITHKLEVTKEFNVWGKTNLILIGSGAASFAPDFIGQKYIDTAGGNVYVAVGVATAGNWKLV
jgi:hypothetical protein